MVLTFTWLWLGDHFDSNLQFWQFGGDDFDFGSSGEHNFDSNLWLWQFGVHDFDCGLWHHDFGSIIWLWQLGDQKLDFGNSWEHNLTFTEGSFCRYRFSASCCSQGFLLHFEWGVLSELQCDDQHVNIHVFSTYKAVWWMLISTFKVLFCLKYWNGGNWSWILKVELWIEIHVIYHLVWFNLVELNFK